jgi:hypothetical protein
MANGVGRWVAQAALSMVTSAVVAGCALDGTPSAESVQIVASEIIRGSLSTPQQNAVVLHVVLDAQGQVSSTCTATLIAPNLILTARHCVSELDPQTDAVTADTPPARMYISTGPSAGAPETPTVSARATQVFTDGARDITGSDVSLVLLDRKITDMPFAPIRLDGRVTAGESLTAVGWGLTENGQLPTSRLQRPAIPVTAVGPAVGGVEGSEFEIGEGGCSGDSGGPALSAKGAVVGVISRVGNGQQQSEANRANFCLGSTTKGIYGEPSAHKELVMRAFQAAGAQPWLEGQPDPRLARIGDKCAAATDCASNLCIAVSSGQICSQSCATDACPSTMTCETVSGQRICVPPVGKGSATGRTSGTSQSGTKSTKKKSSAAESEDEESDELYSPQPARACSSAPGMASTDGLLGVGLAIASMAARRRAKRA